MHLQPKRKMAIIREMEGVHPLLMIRIQKPVKKSF